MPTLTDRYELADLVYSDDAVVAYYAHDRLLNRAVTVELLQAHRAADPIYVQRLIDKARQAALINLPAVAALYDQHVVDGRPFLVLEEVAGPALSAAAPLSAEQAVTLISALAETIEAAQQRQHPLPNINEQTVRIGTEGRFQVLDLGLAQAPAHPAQITAQLGRLLDAAVAADSPATTPLRAIAERAVVGHYASPGALVAELRAVEQRANQATTMLPRVTPTIDMVDADAHPQVTTAMPASSAAAAPTQRRTPPMGLMFGVGGLLLLLLVGGLLLRNREASSVEPQASGVTTTQPSAPAPAPSAPALTGERYVVAARNSQTVRVRSGPGTSSPQIASLPNGTEVQVVSDPQPADGYHWVRVIADGVDGWCILEALRKS
jgi:hypothetical protein